jgi:transposase-like protein
MDLSAFVGKLLEEQDGDVLREGIRVLSQALMETEVAGLIHAERHERTGERTAYRNGPRTRTWDTRMGTIELAIPKVRPETYSPSLLQPRELSMRCSPSSRPSKSKYRLEASIAGVAGEVA